MFTLQNQFYIKEIKKKSQQDTACITCRNLQSSQTLKGRNIKSEIMNLFQLTLSLRFFSDLVIRFSPYILNW